MATSFNSQCVTNGLVYAVDAANPRSFNTAENLLTWSDQLNGWNAQTSTVTVNVVPAPDGSSQAADKITSATDVGIIQTVTYATATVVTASLYLFKGLTTATAVMWRDQGGTGHHIVVDMRSSTITQATNVISSGVTPIGGGWIRIWMSYTTDATSGTMTIRPDSQSGTTDIVAWGAQLEKGLGPSSYTSTAGSTVTRSTNWTDMIGGSSSVATNGPQYNGTNGGWFNLTAASTQYFQHPVYSALDITNNVTLEAWVYPTTWNNTGGVLTYGTDAAEQFALWTSNLSQFVFSSNWPGTWYQQGIGVSLAAGTWYHVVATFSNGTVKGYINGVLSGNTTAFGITTLPAVASSYLTIGNNHPGGDEMLNGRVAMAKIYNRVLTLQEVQQNFNAGRGRFNI
jgi:hypothetical protein